jgi:proteasome activator subunit 4
LNKTKWLGQTEASAVKLLSESYINDQDVEDFVLIMRDLVFTAMFSMTNLNDAIKSFQYLCFLRSDLMLPTLLENMNKCFETSQLAEAHRYAPVLACLASVPRELVKSNQKIIIQLLISVLPGIDINDLNKFILTFQFMTNVLNHLMLCDCSPAIQIRNDLTEDEKELCMLTQNFDDFLSMLMDKLFRFIDSLSDGENASNLNQTEASIFARNNLSINLDNVTQVHVLQMFKVLVQQSSNSILKVKTAFLRSILIIVD